MGYSSGGKRQFWCSWHRETKNPDNGKWLIAPVD